MAGKGKKKEIDPNILTGASLRIGKWLSQYVQEVWERKNQKDGCLRYLTFDLSTTRTGYAVWKYPKQGDPVWEQGGVIKPKGKSDQKRFPQMAAQIVRIIVAQEPDLIVSESMFLRKGFRSIEYALKLHGVEEYAAYMAGIPDLAIGVSTWRKLCGFPSNLDRLASELDPAASNDRSHYYKKRSMELARQVTGTDISDDNYADAICIGFAVSKILQNMR